MHCNRFPIAATRLAQGGRMSGIVSRMLHLVALGVLAGCAHPPQPSVTQLIPVSRVVNSLKCEFARFLTEYRGQRLDLHGWGVSGALTLNVASSKTLGGGVALSGLVPFQGASADLGFQASVTQKYTTTVNVNFELESHAESAQICSAAGDLIVQSGIGFGAWLKTLGDELDQAAAGQPKFAVSGLSYELVFALERAAGASGSLVIVPLAISAEALATRNDVQTLKIELEPPRRIVGRKKDGTPITVPDLKPFGPTVIPRG